MNLGFLTNDLRISSRKFLAALFLNSGTLAWFFLLIICMKDIFAVVTLQDPFWIDYQIGEILFFGFAILWAIVGSAIGGRINRRILLVSSIILGTFSTILLSIVQGTVLAAIVSFFLGVSFGLGLPSSIAFIADYTVVEERARVSGIVILGTFIMAFGSIALKGILGLTILEAALLFAIVRSTSLFALAFDTFNSEEQKLKEKASLPHGAFREFLYYLIPWIMFSIAAGLASNLIPPEIDTTLGTMIRYVMIAIFGLVSGITADRIGRKQPIIIGLIVLAISFAILGFLGFSETIVTLYLAISGIAWGLFFVVFLAVPGDLSVIGYREKFYGVGYILPIAILFSLALVPVNRLFPQDSAGAFSQVLSLLLILSIIPVLRAKETLPEPKMRERRMKEHMEKIRKLIAESKEKE